MKRAVAITPVGFELLASSAAGLWQSSYDAPNLGEDGACFLRRHPRLLSRKLLLQAGDELSPLLARKLMSKLNNLIERWRCHHWPPCCTQRSGWPVSECEVIVARIARRASKQRSPILGLKPLGWNMKPAQAG
jgi:hypothetical protein